MKNSLMIKTKATELLKKMATTTLVAIVVYRVFQKAQKNYTHVSRSTWTSIEIQVH